MTNLWLLGLFLFASETILMFFLDHVAIVDHGSVLQNLIGGLLFVAIMLAIFNKQLRAMLTLKKERLNQIEGEARLRELEDILPDGFVYQVRLDGEGSFHFLYLSAGIEQLTGITDTEVLNDANTLCRQVDPAQIPHILAIAAECKHNLSRFETEARIRHRDGQWRWIQVSARPCQLPDGKTLWNGFAFDITEHKLVEERLRLTSRVFSEVREGIIITDPMGKIVDVNPSFCDITGYSREEVVGKNPNLLNSGKQTPEFFASMWDTLNRDSYWQGELWNRKKSGELFAEHLKISVLRDDHGAIVNYLGLFSDITQTMQQQQTLELMAHYDILTRLPNRALFSDRFAQAIAQSRRHGRLLAVCYMDLDGFKQINDTLGHESGDRLLVEVANRIKSALRKEDTVSRLGGDEFALLLGNISSPDQCEPALARIIQTVSLPHSLDDQQISISASVGVTIFPLDDADPDTLLRHADQAMYQAKMNGRNRYHLFDTSSDKQAKNRQQLLDEIRQAFSRDEFCLYYHPKVNMKTGSVVGVEALLRWHNPERGILLPGQFLPLLEGTEMEVTVGKWVIENALNQMEFWKSQGLELQVSVNISLHHLQWSGFLTHLESALAQHPDIPSSNLELEVLESSVPNELADVAEVIRNCHTLYGVSVALDDFGTGYSSLIQLRRLPANTIKIDQSFVRDMIDDPNDFAIVSGVLGLASGFRREVVAEGVASMEHGLILLAMGCLLGQGHGIAHPMPAEKVKNWVQSYQPYKEWTNYDFDQITPSAKQLMLVRIESDQWMRRMEECLNSPPDAVLHWPIMDHSKCHCGRWVEQARHDQFFSPGQLDQIYLAHEELHRIGSSLMRERQADYVDNAPVQIEKLRIAYRKVCQILEQWNTGESLKL
jgi:diguanylate cyclase (GGDEF)-like protein/PAS domain S-box-containing protein